MNRKSSRLAEKDVRDRIFSEHAILRRAMAALARETGAAQKNIVGAIARMRTAATEVRDAFERHLAYEESVLVPLLREADAWGPIRATHVLDDHRQQRAVLLAFVEDVTEGAKPIDELADEIAWLLRGLLRDMNEEETKLLAAYERTGCSIVIDQTDG